jgi:hypothetical protein
MIDRDLLVMDPSDLIALYEECRFQPGSPYRDEIRAAIEHRAAASPTGSLDCYKTGITYKWSAVLGSVVRREISRAILSAASREATNRRELAKLRERNRAKQTAS